MPATGDGISTKISVLGDKEYKTALQDINRTLTVLNTSMAASQSAFGDQANSMDAMKAKGESLKSIYDAHAEKVRLVSEQLNKAKEEYGENSKQADTLQIALNRAQTAMNNVAGQIEKNDSAMAALAESTQGAGDAHEQAETDTQKLEKALKNSANEAASYDQQLREVERTLKEGGDQTEGLAQKQELLQKKLDAQRSACDTLAEAYAKSVEETGEFSDESVKLAKQLQDQRDAADKTASALDENADAMSKAASASSDMEGKTDKATDAVEDEGDAAEEAEEKNSALADAMGTAGDIAQGALKVGLAAATAAVGVLSAAVTTAGKGIVESLGTYAEYDDAMRQVQATMNKGADEMNNLRAAAEEAGATTKFTATDAAEALNYLALAGYSEEKAIKALPSILNLAAAGNMDLAKASDMATDAMSALGLTDMDAFLDSMAKTSQKANASVEQLGEGILAVGATGKMVAGGVDELNLVLGLLADNGIKGAEGGTKLRNMILSLSSPTDKGAMALERLGVSVFDSSGQMRSMETILRDLSSAMEGMSDEEKTDLIGSIFNKTDLAAVNALLETSGERWDELSDEIAKADGTCAEMAGTLEAGLGGSLRSLSSATEGLQIAIAKNFDGIASDMVDGLTQVARDATAALNDGFQPEDITTIGESVAAYLSKGIGTVTGLIETGAPLLAAAIGKAVGVVVEALPGLLDALLPAAMSLLQSLLDAVTDNLEPLADLATNVVTNVATFLMKNAGSLLGAGVKLLTTIAGGIASALPKLIPTAVSMITELVTGLVSQIPALVTAAGALMQGLVDGLAAALPVLIEALPAVITAITDALTESLPVILEQGAGIIGSIISGIAGAIPALASALPAVITAITGALAGALPGILTQGAAIIGSVISGIAGAIPTLVDALPAVVTAITGALSEALPDILAQGTAIISNIVSGISEGIPTLTEALPTVITTVVDAIVEGLPDVLTQGAEILASLIEGIGGAIPSLIEAMPGVVSAITDAFGEIDWLQMGSDLLTGLLNGLTAAKDVLLESITGVFGSIWQAILDVFGIASPSTKAAEAGGFILAGLAGGLQAGLEAVLGVVSSVFGAIWDAIKGIFGFGKGESEESKEANQTGQDIMTGLKDGITGSEETVKAAIKGAAKTALDALATELGVSEGSSTKTKPYGERVSSGIADGMTAATAETFKAAASSIASAVIEAINGAFGVEGTGFLGLGESGAKQFESVGAAVTKSIADGISNNEGNIEAIKSAITDVANAAYEATVLEMATGITGGSDTVNAAIDAVATAAHETAAAILTKDAGDELGTDYIDGIRKGVQGARVSLVLAMTTVATAAHQAAAQALSSALGYSVGSEYGQGVASGIQSQAGSAASAASSIASAALSALRASVGSFESVGESIAQSVARGIRNGASAISSAAKSAASSAASAASSSTSSGNASRYAAQPGSPVAVAQTIASAARSAARSILDVVPAPSDRDGPSEQAIAASGARMLASVQSLAQRAAADTDPDGSIASRRPRDSRPQAAASEIDYDRLGDAVAMANKRAGVGTAVVTLDKRKVSKTLEPDISRETYRRSGGSVKGRASRLQFA